MPFLVDALLGVRNRRSQCQRVSAIACCAVLAALSSCRPIQQADRDERMSFSRALIVYMAASNSLDGYVADDIEDIRIGMSGLGPDSVAFVLVSRAKTNALIDWDDTKLYMVRGGSSPVQEELDAPALGLSADYIDEYLNLADVAVLHSYLRAIADSYKADTWYLDLWDHGGGWKGIGSREFAQDDATGECMDMMGMRKALFGMDGATPVIHFSIVMADACYLGSIEVASDMMGLADYFVASPDTIAADGFPYQNFMPILFGTQGEQEKACQLCDSFGRTYAAANASLSAIKIDADSAMQTFLDGFEEALPSIDSNTLRATLGDYSRKSEGAVDVAALAGAMPGLDDLLGGIMLKTFSTLGDSISIFLPEYPSYNQYWEYYDVDHVHFLELSPAYRDFLSTYSHSAVVNIDTYEQNGKPANAKDIQKGDVSSFIWCEDDIDYFQIVSDGQGLTVSLTPPASHDYDLRLIGKLGQPDAWSITSEHTLSVVETIAIGPGTVVAGEALYIEVFAANDYSQMAPYALHVE